jgi:hypothetical protein
MQKRGPVIFRHDEIRDKLVNLASRAFTPLAAHNKPLIHSRANENVKPFPNKTAIQDIDKEAATREDERGDLLIQGFWTAGTDCILDVHATDADDAKSHCKRTPFKAPELQQKEKKRKCLGHALRLAITSHLSCSQWTDCSDGKLKPLQMSCSETCRKVAEALFAMRRHMKARLSTAAACATHLCLRGSRVPAHDVSARFSQQ